MVDATFLEQCGLGGLDDESKQGLLEQVTHELEHRVGSILSQGMSDADFAEFEGFMDRDERIVYTWLQQNHRDYASDTEYHKLCQAAGDSMSPLEISAEYASLLWLKMHRPNYREIVMAELERLGTELRAFAARVIDGAATQGSVEREETPATDPDAVPMQASAGSGR